MPISTWIRDLFGIRKDIIDTKKTKLEITKLEAEERERNLITPATMGDVKKYDPSLRKLLGRISGMDQQAYAPMRPFLFYGALFLLIVFGEVLLYLLIRWLF